MKRSEVMAIVSNKDQTEKETVQAIMDLHQTDAELWKAEKGELQTEISKLKNDVTDVQKEFDDYKTSNSFEDEKTKLEADISALKAKFEAEAAAHKSTRDSYQAERDAADTDSKISNLLKEKGMNVKVIDKALKLYDRSAVKKGKDGKIENADKVIESFKSEWADFFGETSTQGALVGNPPANVAGGNANPKNVNTYMNNLIRGKDVSSNA